MDLSQFCASITSRLDSLSSRIDSISSHSERADRLQQQLDARNQEYTSVSEELRTRDEELKAQSDRLHARSEEALSAQRKYEELYSTHAELTKKAPRKGRLGEELTLDMMRDRFAGSGVEIRETAREGSRKMGDFVLTCSFTDPPLKIMMDTKFYDSASSRGTHTHKLSGEAADYGCTGLIVLYRKVLTSFAESQLKEATEAQILDAQCINVSSLVKEEARSKLDPFLCFACTFESFEYTFLKMLSNWRKRSDTPNPELQELQKVAASLVKADYAIDQTFLFHMTKEKFGELRGEKKRALLELRHHCQSHSRPEEVDDLLRVTELFDAREGKPLLPPQSKRAK